METQPSSEPVKMTRFEAQRKLGLIAPIDYIFAALLLIGLVTFLVCFLGEFLADLKLVLLLVSLLFVGQIWLTLLVYRVLVFVLDVQADINLMPEAAARIVLGYYNNYKK